MAGILDRVRSWVTKGRSRDKFTELASLTEARLHRFLAEPVPTPNAGHVAVLVTPWLGTAVPLFSLECAMMLARTGYRVTLIFDTADVVANSPEAAHSEILKRLVEMFRQKGAVISVEDAGTTPPDHSTAQLILQSNAIWRMRGEDKAAEFAELQPNALEQIATHLGKVTSTLQAHRFDWLLVPGGFFGLSGIYVAAARQLGLAFSTYDSAVGVLRLAHDSIAAHLGDLPKTFAALRPHWRTDAEHKTKIVDLARAEIDDRASTKDFRQFQVAPSTQRDDLAYDILVPLNIRWDSAALGRQRLFPSVGDWLSALLTWVAEHPTATICIRQHPRERLDFARSSDRLAPLLERFSGLGARLRYVEAAEAVNTYDLLRNARIVLPHTSTVGIEAAMLGKAVALSANCYYEHFGFCHSPETREQYFEYIQQAISSEIAPSKAEQEDAALAYYLTQRCAFVRTDFTANPVDAQKWLTLSPEELWARPEVADFKEALIKREPLSMVRHRRLQDAH